MTAKEMFEKLGYKETLSNELFIEYFKDGLVNYKIVFCLEEKCIELESKLAKNPHTFFRIDTHLLQTINKQVEELGWLDE